MADSNAQLKATALRTKVLEKLFQSLEPISRLFEEISDADNRLPAADFAACLTGLGIDAASPPLAAAIDTHTRGGMVSCAACLDSIAATWRGSTPRDAAPFVGRGQGLRSCSVRPSDVRSQEPSQRPQAVAPEPESEVDFGGRLVGHAKPAATRRKNSIPARNVDKLTTRGPTEARSRPTQRKSQLSRRDHTIPMKNMAAPKTTASNESRPRRSQQPVRVIVRVHNFPFNRSLRFLAQHDPHGGPSL